MTPAEAEVWATVQALNRTWTTGNVDDLADHFHPDMIAITPTDRDRLEGRESVWRES